MSEFYCLDIEIPKTDFNSFYVKGRKEVSLSHQAHLSATKDQIEIKIFFDDTTYFGDRLMFWTKEIDWGKFGSYLRINLTNDIANDRLLKIDLSESKLLGAKNGSNFYENDRKFVLLKIDSAKFYWSPIEHENLSAEFYLDDKGFRIVEQFYSSLSPKSYLKNEGQFDITRMNDSKEFYILGKSRFRPEYNFVPKDNRKDRVATVTKEPKIQFKYQKEITEQEATFYGDVVLMVASFFHHIKINYILRRIHLPQYTITLKQLEQYNFFNTSGNLRGFGIYWDFNRFLKSNWQKETLKNYDLLSKAIELLNQSHLVDNSSAFLIRYNIIEICDNQKRSKEKFTHVLSNNLIKEKQYEALIKLLETIDPSEHDDFKTRWKNVQSLLSTKPMKGQLTSFLESQNIETKILPISISKLTELRNNIIHGSINKIDSEQLKKANTLLYRISGILILNLMGIDEWKLDTKIK
jgi:hypothetical protein